MWHRRLQGRASRKEFWAIQADPLPLVANPCITWSKGRFSTHANKQYDQTATRTDADACNREAARGVACPAHGDCCPGNTRQGRCGGPPPARHRLRISSTVRPVRPHAPKHREGVISPRFVAGDLLWCAFPETEHPATPSRIQHIGYTLLVV